MTTKTELDFSYEPSDFFEVPTSPSQMAHGELIMNNGKAVYALSDPMDPISDAFREVIQTEVMNVFKLRKMRIHKTFELNGPHITQHHADGRQDRVAVIHETTGALVASLGSLDLVIEDGAGNVLHDSRAERITADTAIVTSILPKMGHATVAKMVDSFCNAVDDANDELIHLFEIAEAAADAFGGDERAARSGLSLTKREWDKLTDLANDKSIRQGRHRGQEAVAMRDATTDELEEARQTARKIMQSFAALVQ